MKKLFHQANRIAIAGCSIAGPAVAAELIRLGQPKEQIQLFESGKREALKSRGTGIMLPSELCAILTKTFKSFPLSTLPVKSRSFIVPDNKKKPWGRVLHQQPLLGNMTLWRHLHENLMAHVPSEIITDCAQVTGSTETSDGIQLNFSNNKASQSLFDTVVWCDGLYSTGRKTIFSASAELPSYQNYIAWRGIVDNEDMSAEEIEHFKEQILYHCYDRGHSIACLVPGDDGKAKLNWICYEALSRDKLDLLAISAKTNHSLSEQAISHFEHTIKSHMLKAFAELLLRSNYRFAQPIYSAYTSSFVKQTSAGKHLILGDAGTVYKPHVGSGSSIAVKQAIGLARALRSESALSEMKSWEQQELAGAKKAMALADRMAEWLVFNPPHWQNTSSKELEAQWLKVQGQDKWYTPQQTLSR